MGRLARIFCEITLYRMDSTVDKQLPQEDSREHKRRSGNGGIGNKEAMSFIRKSGQLS